jgi:hypothetical protein
MRLHTLTAAPAVHALAASAAVWLLLFVYCNYALWRDPHGAYFHSEGAYDLGYSEVRREEARKLIEAHDNQTATKPVICAGIATVARDHPEAARYFEDTVGSMLEGLTEKERSALQVNVLFANAAGPMQHPDWKKPWLELVDRAAWYENVTDDEVEELRFMEADGDFQKKGVHDYVYALEQCYETGAPYVAVFEDDILFAKDWLARTLLGLQGLAGRSDWLYLRLFYSETYLTWDGEKDWWYGHMPLTLMLVAAATAAVARYRRLGGWTVAAVSLVIAPAFTALFFMAGKYNTPLYALRKEGVVPMDWQACCSQALVFDRARVPELVAYLRLRKRGQTDMMIEEYCDEKPLRRFALGEQAVQHLGVRSSRGGGGVQGNSVWAFYFEQTRAEAVERRKRESLAKIDWAAFERMRAW